MHATVVLPRDHTLKSIVNLSDDVDDLIWNHVRLLRQELDELEGLLCKKRD